MGKTGRPFRMNSEGGDVYYGHWEDPGTKTWKRAEDVPEKREGINWKDIVIGVLVALVAVLLLRSLTEGKK